MSDSIRKLQSLDECNADGKVKYLLTAGGSITCLRCQAKSTRTKMQCGRPALTISSDIAVVLRKVREKVMKTTGNKQQPWEYGSLTGGALVLSAIKPK